MVAASDLGSDAERRGGSSPFIRTQIIYYYMKTTQTSKGELLAGIQISLLKEDYEAEVTKALKNIIVNYKDKKETITMQDIVKLGLTGNEDSLTLRLKICEELHLGYCSTNKTFIKRLNSLDIDYLTLKTLLERIDKNDCE